MNNYNATSIIKKYKLCLYGVFGLFLVAAIVVLVLTNNNILYGLSLLAALLAMKIAQVILYNQFISAILTKEMNLPKYINVIETGKIVSRSLMEHLYIAYYSGDYNKAINICKIQLENKKYAKYKHYYLLMLARVYCEIGDFENLRTVNEMFKSFIANNKNGNKIKEKLIFFKFVDLYLAEDFSTAKDLYEKGYLLRKEKQSKPNWGDVSANFTFAVCCYKCGDFAKASQVFHDVIAAAPSFHYAKIAKRYIDAIANNVNYLPEQITTHTDTSNIPTPGSRKKNKILYVIGLSLIFISIISSIIDSITMPKQPVHFKGLDYHATQSDVHKLYGKPKDILGHPSLPGQRYDFYNVEYLGIPATLQFTYYHDSDVLYCSRFTIDSTQFSSYEEYQSAVNTTCDYFSKTLFKYRTKDQSNEDEKYITWFYDEGGYCYRMFEAELMFSKEENDVRECAVFEFLKYNG